MKNEAVGMLTHILFLTHDLNIGTIQHHWTKLSQSLIFEFVVDEEITLQDALKLKIEDKLTLFKKFLLFH
jgi:hypothetical protein